VFVEADADVRLEELGKPLLPPYPCVEELLCDAGETRAVIGKPLVLMQVYSFLAPFMCLLARIYRISLISFMLLYVIDIVSFMFSFVGDEAQMWRICYRIPHVPYHCRWIRYGSIL